MSRITKQFMILYFTLGKVKVDIAWGGMFYCIIDVRQFEGLELIPEMEKKR